MSIKLKTALEDGIRKVRDYDACLASEDAVARYTEIRDKAKKALARMEAECRRRGAAGPEDVFLLTCTPQGRVFFAAKETEKE